MLMMFLQSILMLKMSLRIEAVFVTGDENLISKYVFTNKNVNYFTDLGIYFTTNHTINRISNLVHKLIK